MLAGSPDELHPAFESQTHAGFVEAGHDIGVHAQGPRHGRPTRPELASAGVRRHFRHNG